jgi:hypothetical protein
MNAILTLEDLEEPKELKCEFEEELEFEFEEGLKEGRGLKVDRLETGV